MATLNMTLNNTAIGGHVGGQLLNHLCYADDICLISISSAGMQELLMFVTHIPLNTRFCIMEISHTLCVLSQLLSNLRDPVFT